MEQQLRPFLVGAVNGAAKVGDLVMTVGNNGNTHSKETMGSSRRRAVRVAPLPQAAGSTLETALLYPAFADGATFLPSENQTGVLKLPTFH